MQTLAELPRVWAGTYLPDYHDWGERFRDRTREELKQRSRD